MTKICKKAAQHFHCADSKVFDRAKSVATIEQAQKINVKLTVEKNLSVLQERDSSLSWSRFLLFLAAEGMTKICKKAAQHFHCAVSKVFDRVKSVALWSANIRKLAKDHKGYDRTL